MENRMKKNRSILLLLFAVVLFVSCEVDFSPNAEWKDVPVVYCVLDQDDDTTWARVERCYLGNADIHTYSSVSDSFNYQPGAIRVALLAYHNGVLQDSLPFTYTERTRREGEFANEAQPMYYCRTKDLLKENCQYVIHVWRNSDNTLIASSKPVSLVVQTAEKVITKPWSSGRFGFYDRNGSSSAFCRIEWPALQNARRYQPVVRFYYSIDDTVMYEDFMCGNVPGSTASSYYLYYPRVTFLEELQQRLKNDPREKVYLRMFDIYLMACSEELNAYLSTESVASSDVDMRQVYSNIDNGIGVLGARRTHLYITVPGDSSNVNNVGLYYFLMNLGINMI